MADPSNQERRRHERYDTKIKLYFNVSYDLETKVNFRVVDGEGPQGGISRKYTAFSKNVSTDGMCFNSEKRLSPGDTIQMEVFIPKETKAIHMTAEVRWSDVARNPDRDIYPFDTGVKIKNIEGKDVFESIHFDEEYKIEWSDVLESILGGYKTKSFERKIENP